MDPYNNVDLAKRKLSLILLSIFTLLLVLSVVVKTFSLFRSKPKNLKPAASQNLAQNTFAPTLKPPADPKVQLGPFHCPSLLSFCNNGTYKESSVFAKLAANTPLFAAFEGKMELLSGSHPTDKGNETFDLITLTNEAKGLRALYYFHSSEKNHYQQKEVKEGDALANIDGKAINYLGDNSLIFQILLADKDKVNLMILNKNLFKND